MEGRFRCLSLAGQRVMAWAANRTRLSQVPDMGKRTIWLL